MSVEHQQRFNEHLYLGQGPRPFMEDLRQEREIVIDVGLYR